jgi:hypothetical protein
MKKFFKFLFFLITLPIIIYAVFHFWNVNEDKKETQLNLAFFTSENYDGDFIKGVNWAPVTTYYGNNNSRGAYQQGFNENGEMFYREVRRDEKPPTVAVYRLEERLGVNHLFVKVYWIIDCTPGSSKKHQLSETLTKDLKCSDNGKYLHLTPIGWGPTEVSRSEINVLGFNYSVSTNPFDMNQLVQNKTLQKLKEEGS